MPHIGNHLTSLYLLSYRNANAGTMRVQSFQPITMINLYMVSVTSSPTVSGVGDCYGTGCSGQDGRSFRCGNICTAMVTGFTADRIGSITKLGSNTAGNGGAAIVKPHHQCQSIPEP